MIPWFYMHILIQDDFIKVINLKMQAQFFLISFFRKKSVLKAKIRNVILGQNVTLLITYIPSTIFTLNYLAHFISSMEYIHVSIINVANFNIVVDFFPKPIFHFQIPIQFCHLSSVNPVFHSNHTL